eukprot:TRINITY_DN1798_c0_g1_i1.p1 TRINITY_DN1798_c0_g1~~TRINITY_DN1798_c0_g1_i1.p1  ORF type:complete len:447 (-),score=122.22 TRINITY_DN1798_c0_g1_i1:76-1416(-)
MIRLTCLASCPRPLNRVIVKNKSTLNWNSSSSQSSLANFYQKKNLNSFQSLRSLSLFNNSKNSSIPSPPPPPPPPLSTPLPSTPSVATTTAAPSSPIEPSITTATSTGNEPVSLSEIAKDLQNTMEALSDDPITAKVKTEGDFPNWFSPFFDAIGIHPVAYTQDLFLAIHEMSGMPWWSEIIALTIVSRMIFIKLFADNLKTGITMANLAPITKEINQRMQKATDITDKLKVREELTAMWKEHGISPFKPLKNQLKQMPVFLLCFLALRDPTFSPAMAYEGAAWFKNLMVTDPTYFLPLINALGLVTSIQLGVDNPAAAKNKPLMTGLSVIGAGFLLFISHNFPASVLIYWAAQSWVGVGINLLLKRTRLREFFKIPHYIDIYATAPIVKPDLVLTQKSGPAELEIPATLQPPTTTSKNEFKATSTYTVPPVPQGSGNKKKSHRKK